MCVRMREQQKTVNTRQSISALPPHCYFTALATQNPSSCSTGHDSAPSVTPLWLNVSGWVYPGMCAELKRFVCQWHRSRGSSWKQDRDRAQRWMSLERGGGGGDGIRLTPRPPAIDHMDRHDARAPAAGDKKRMLFWNEMKGSHVLWGTDSVFCDSELDFHVFIWQIFDLQRHRRCHMKKQLV